jgi:hypothetical protein
LERRRASKEMGLLRLRKETKYTGEVFNIALYIARFISFDSVRDKSTTPPFQPPRFNYILLY